MYTYIPISPPCCISLSPSLSHPSRWSQSTQLNPLCYAAASHQLFYIWQCIYVNVTLSLCPSLPFPLPVSSSPFSMSVSLSLSYPQVLQNLFFFFLSFHIYVLAYSICFSLSDLLQKVSGMTDSRSIHLTTSNSISFLFMVSNSPLYICASYSLSIHLSMDTQFASMSWLL